MSRQVIIVNGVPASGKSTISEQLVAGLTAQGVAAVPLSLDSVKEGLFAHIGTGDRAHNRLLCRASYHAMFNSIAGFPDGLVPVVDAWHGFQPDSVLREHLQRARVARVIEVWCGVTPQTAADRYRARISERHPGHLPASYADELFTLTQSATPMGFGPVIKVDAESDFDPRIFTEIRTLLAGGDSRIRANVG